MPQTEILAKKKTVHSYYYYKFLRFFVNAKEFNELIARLCIRIHISLDYNFYDFDGCDTML